ncbi:GtrA family protein [Aquabacterium sp.]|uniref:GtrA family protein n=1 Tax=Aquabacterium sp. TaxID=1872578 RepID=UPI002C581BE6|nr:GtrA family protein [Aquabacterium sp.]HSW05009.1 GtrA family protein [Aquabacterium sp.]
MSPAAAPATPLSGATLLRQFASFAAIGALNAGIHVALVAGLVEAAGWTPVPANVLAFVVANLFSFWANSRWTFQSRRNLRRYARFITVSLAGLALTLSISALGQALGWHYLASVALLVGVLPIVSFGANRFWTWRPAPSPDQST